MDDSMAKRPVIWILNGPNLNLLGIREPEIYGNQSFDTYFRQLQSRYPEIDLHYYHSNHEGDLLDKLHEIGFSCTGIVFNPGAYTHTSIALADAVKAIESPVFEVHISDVSRREPFRQISYLRPYCSGHIMGEGLAGYDKAIRELLSLRK